LLPLLRLYTEKAAERKRFILSLALLLSPRYRASMNGSRNFFLGCAVWAYKGWIGEFYPLNSKPTDFLRLYSRRLTAVEGNTTFYAVPDTDTLARWVADTPAGFVFCLKLPRELTHQRLLQPSIPGALRFLEQVRGLGERLGPLFAQLPPHYGPALLDDLTAFLNAWPRHETPLALEVRHPAWFQEPHASTLTDTLKRLGVGRVLLDSRPIYSGPDDPQVHIERRKPKLPLQPVVTAPFSLVRFISHPQQEFNPPFLTEWVETLDRWFRQGIQVYFFVHCPVEAHSPQTARFFQHLLEQRQVPVPPLPGDTLSRSPAQLSLFEGRVG
jgi:uncharacterized protein YecE (DUF72 family)